MKRVVRAEADIDAAAAERLTSRLNAEIASLSLRNADDEALAEAAAMAQIETASAHAEPVPADMATATDTATPVQQPQTAAAPATDSETFDPYSPNVVVVIRTRGRDATLAALSEIREVANLKLLAREQQLGIASDLASPDEIRLAIVAAAERRIANRRAAAS
ncbi:MAG: hypothetical protein R3D67_19560 [Hyphomicrobiaceae bacterium]